MSRTLEYFFDYGSLASYLAWTQLPALARETGATLAYRPMLLGGLFKATGNASPMAVPAKFRYVAVDFQRCAARYGVPLNFNPHFPINTLVLMRAITWLLRDRPADVEPFNRLAFEAIWVNEIDMNDAAQVERVLREGSFDPAEVLAMTQRQDVKEALKATTEEAERRGAFGAPTMYVGDEMFFGQDRLDFVREALAR